MAETYGVTGYFMISSIRLGISFQLMRLKPTSGQLVTMCVAVAVILRVSVDVAISRSVTVSVTVKNSDTVDVGSIVLVTVTVLAVRASFRDVTLDLVPGRRKMLKRFLKRNGPKMSGLCASHTTKAQITTNINNHFMSHLM